MKNIILTFLSGLWLAAAGFSVTIFGMVVVELFKFVPTLAGFGAIAAFIALVALGIIVLVCIYGLGQMLNTYYAKLKEENKND